MFTEFQRASECSANTHAQPLAPLPLPRNRQEEENRAIELVPNSHCCPIFHSQDPEFQKHATQILRNMLRQEERELQVRPLLRADWPQAIGAIGQCVHLDSQATFYYCKTLQSKTQDH